MNSVLMRVTPSNCILEIQSQGYAHKWIRQYIIHKIYLCVTVLHIFYLSIHFNVGEYGMDSPSFAEHGAEG